MQRQHQLPNCLVALPLLLCLLLVYVRLPRRIVRIQTEFRSALLCLPHKTECCRWSSQSSASLSLLMLQSALTSLLVDLLWQATPVRRRNGASIAPLCYRRTTLTATDDADCREATADRAKRRSIAFGCANFRLVMRKRRCLLPLRNKLG